MRSAEKIANAKLLQGPDFISNGEAALLSRLVILISGAKISCLISGTKGPLLWGMVYLKQVVFFVPEVGQ